MSTRARATVLLASAAVLAACTTGDRDAGPPSSSSPAESSTVTDAPATEESPLDPGEVDLGEETWSFGSVGYTDPPVDVTLSGGTAELTFATWEGVVEMGEPTDVDLDGDGDDDVIAPLSFLADQGGGVHQWVLTEWYAWVNRDGALEQIVYPIESSGDCADGDATFTPSTGGGVQIEQMRMAEDSVCAEGATVAVTRVVELAYGERGEVWPMQTEPVLAWGGDCPLLMGPSDGIVDLVVAPGVQSPVSPTAEPIAVGMRESWLDQAVPGWSLVGFATAEQQIEEYACGWTTSG